MNKDIIIKLQRIQGVLDKDIMKMALALLEKRDSNEYIIDFKSTDMIEDFLWIRNQYEYMRFADVLFWVDDEKFKEHQNDIIMYKVPNQSQYICIGQIEPYPILLNKKNGNVYCVTSELGEKCKIKEYNKFRDFFNQYVIGERYLELGSSEKWYNFMKQYEII
ncbi:hypothetical protein [Clostridium gasigenes]|uniref:Uncharacterized protein n=1 Tax=Clostridium gasigenes TaxID=94869 RepID=A0A1H0QHK0_9CLOT|nr:hypothetical protein [Clostridium gasigenes]MBB6624496.1 hypothetical protein [Clostridium gasigenes]SDP16206.1 hypothetical protein SAMN04488529_102345 [Clostridium gasigenes]